MGNTLEKPRHSAYLHLINFLKRAPKPQINRFWKEVGIQASNVIAAAKQRRSTGYVWLKTRGYSLNWLHFKIQSEPSDVSHPRWARYPKMRFMKTWHRSYLSNWLS